jgi:outer membrane protein assembly factor BamB
MFILPALLLAGPVIAAQSALWPPTLPIDTHWQKPLPFGDEVQVHVGDSRVVISTSTHLDAWTWATGEPAWAADMPVTHAPLLDDGRVYVASGDDVVGLSELTGRVEWRFPGGAAAIPMTSRAGWLLVTNAAGGITALRSADGTRVWSRAADGPLVQPIAVDGDAFYTVTATTLSAWAIADGTPRWQVPAAGTRGLFAGHNRVFIASTGYLSSYAQRTGRRQWSYAVAMPPISRLTADALHVYFAGLDNSVHAFRADNGHMIWKRPVASRIVEGLTADGGLVYIPQASGEVSLVVARTGKVTARLSVPATQSLGADRLTTAGALDTLRLARLTVSDTNRVLTTFARRTLAPTTSGVITGTPVPLSTPPPPRRP